MSASKLTLREVSDIAVYCAEEVRRQQRGPTQVGNMVEAWMAAIQIKQASRKFSHSVIRHLAAMIEPTRNDVTQYRGGPVWVGDHPGVQPELLNDRMERWLEFEPDMTPEQAYYEFELIHPFADGNGRTGKVIYNWKRNSLRAPVFPPDMFGGISNP